MAVIRVKPLGLAAYIKMRGCNLLEVTDKHFLFETDRTLEDWRTEYTNTDCMRHDSMVCELRQFIKGA